MRSATQEVATDDGQAFLHLDPEGQTAGITKRIEVLLEVLTDAGHRHKSRREGVSHEPTVVELREGECGFADRS